jgi:hypothetical protein
LGVSGSGARLPLHPYAGKTAYDTKAVFDHVLSCQSKKLQPIDPTLAYSIRGPRDGEALIGNFRVAPIVLAACDHPGKGHTVVDGNDMIGDGVGVQNSSCCSGDGQLLDVAIPIVSASVRVYLAGRPQKREYSRFAIHLRVTKLVSGRAL